MMSFWGAGKIAQESNSGTGINIKQLREAKPQFAREYAVAISRDVKLEVTIKWFLFGDTMKSGILTQTGGRWVVFDPERPADKILDRELLPEIQDRCAEILRLDKEWRANKPPEFTDENGNRWVKQ